MHMALYNAEKTDKVDIWWWLIDNFSVSFFIKHMLGSLFNRLSKFYWVLTTYDFMEKILNIIP